MAQNELVYIVMIYRYDQQDLRILESEDFKEVKAAYQGLVQEWTSSTAEKRPFEHPIELQSFHPSLISEIKVETMSKEEFHKQSNPHYKQMRRDGLGGVMNQNFNTNGGAY